MASYNILSILSILFLFIFSLGGSSSSGIKSKLSSYIVHTDEDTRPSDFATLNEWHSHMMNMLTQDDSSKRIFYGHDIVMKGFAARMTKKEAAYLRRVPGVSAVIADTMKMTLHTTHTPQFLDLNEGRGLWPAANFGDDVVIGLVDSGVWPESASFRDDGLGPILGWTGACNFESPSLCNNKLITAKSFLMGYCHFVGDENEGDYDSPRDTDGHGTHTASIAAGASVSGASLFGFADGTARGIANSSKFAIYKACGPIGCADSDVLAAMESAIFDGVHVLSLSMGHDDAPFYDGNFIARGAFAAVQRGIFVVCSAGNEGPLPYSVVNTAPWITTVGAGSIDRTFPVHIFLGNGQLVIGSSLYVSSGESTSKSYKLIYTDDCNILDSVYTQIKGNILVCTGEVPEAVVIGLNVQKGDGEGLIILNRPAYGTNLLAQPFTLPAAVVGYTDGITIRDYISMTDDPTAAFLFSNTSIGGSVTAPVVAAFSSRGPNPVVAEILKPDIIAPGLNILADFPSNIAPSLIPIDERRADFNIMSGTSMACPHVAGVAALLIAAHRDWSPAAIRSAIMTTSSMMDNQFHAMSRSEDLQSATPLDYGAGHINPNSAIDPGLVYDTHANDYINFMCSLNYTPGQMRMFVGPKYPCPPKNYLVSPSDLNYPSISVVFREGSNYQTIVRIVTNVGDVQGPEIYQSGIQNEISNKVTITIEPTTLTFTRALEKKAFRVRIISSGRFTGERVTGYICWTSDKNHYVQSPTLISWE